MDFQLKSATVYQFRDTDINLRVENYNRLTEEKDIPRVFLLFTMPDDESEWLTQSLDELCLRKCAYWVSFMGDDPSSNVSTKRVFVPRANVFDQNGLRSVFSYFGLINSGGLLWTCTRDSDALSRITTGTLSFMVGREENWRGRIVVWSKTRHERRYQVLAPLMELSDT